MSKDRVIQIVCVVVALAAVAGSAMLTPALNRQRRDLQLTYGLEVGDRLPPEYALLPALGSLRGIIVDILWYRAEMMKREGKFHESKNLSEFITKLQPRFPDVWVYHAWNLAFNISVETYTPEERWDWVRSGVTLLRDQGLVYNPNSVQLYKELGWQLFFKLGKNMDDAHMYYKTRWAEEWNQVLGEPRRGRVEGKTEPSGIPVFQATEDFAKIADAADLYFTGERRVDPITLFEQKNPDCEPLIAALRAADIPFNAAGLRRIGYWLQFEPYFGNLKPVLDSLPPAAPKLERDALAVAADPALRKQLDTFLPLWRAKALIEDYHMKPQKMLEVMRRYGPLDWRHPASHGAYFNYMGVEMAGELRNDNKIDILNTARGEIHAMQLLTETGNVVYNPLTEQVDLLPDPRFIPAYDIAWDKAINDVVDQRGDWQGDGVKDNFADGHENFLLRAMLLAYFYGDEADARRYYDKARDLYGNREYNQRTGRYSKTLEDLILSEYANDWSMPAVMLAFIEGQIQLGIVNGLRNGRGDIYNRFVGLARQAFEKHKDEYDYSNTVTGSSRMALSRNWDEMLTTIYANTLKAQHLPLLDRSRIWFNTPPDLQLATYVMFRAPLQQECEAQGLNFARAFPPPPGFVEPNAPVKPKDDQAIQNIERK